MFFLLTIKDTMNTNEITYVKYITLKAKKCRHFTNTTTI